MKNSPGVKLYLVTVNTSINPNEIMLDSQENNVSIH